MYILIFVERIMITTGQKNYGQYSAFLVPFFSEDIQAYNSFEVARYYLDPKYP